MTGRRAKGVARGCSKGRLVVLMTLAAAMTLLLATRRSKRKARRNKVSMSSFVLIGVSGLVAPCDDESDVECETETTTSPKKKKKKISKKSKATTVSSDDDDDDDDEGSDENSFIDDEAEEADEEDEEEEADEDEDITPKTPTKKRKNRGSDDDDEGVKKEKKAKLMGSPSPSKKDPNATTFVALKTETRIVWETEKYIDAVFLYGTNLTFNSGVGQCVFDCHYCCFRRRTYLCIVSSETEEASLRPCFG